jgi:hypothetical protein
MAQTKIGWRPYVATTTPTESSLWTSIYSAYNADAVGSSSLKTSLFAAYNGESNANDSFGTNNGTAVGGLTYGTGKIGNAFTFNGSNSYVSLPNDSYNNLTGDFSISFWVNYSSLSGIQSIFSDFTYNGTNLWGIGILAIGNGLRFAIYDGTSTQISLDILGGQAMYTSTWYHYTITRKANTGTKIYRNGTLLVSDTNTTNPVYNSGNIRPAIGAHNYGPLFSNLVQYYMSNGSKLDAVTVWQKELTSTEITELYNSGNGAQYIGDNFYKPTTNDALNTYNGTAQGGLTYGVGKVGTAFVGNGTNAYITLANNSFKFTNSQSFSISTWVNITNSNVSNIIFSSWLFSGSQGYGWLLRTSPYSSTQCNLAFITDWQGGSGTPIPLSVSNAFTINTWVFVTATRNGSTGVEKIYVNGSQIATRTLTPNYLYTSNTVYPSILAQKYDSSSVSGYLNGKIDELNIWTKELTSTEVTELYNSGNGKQYPN